MSKSSKDFFVFQHSRHLLAQSNQTTIWTTEKKLWIQGPDVVTFFSTYLNPYYTVFASVINSSTILLIGGNNVTCFNIVKNRWTKYPNFPYPLSSPLNPSEYNPEMISGTLNMDKNGKRYAFKEILVSFTFWKSHSHFFLFFRTLEVFLQIGL